MAIPASAVSPGPVPRRRELPVPPLHSLVEVFEMRRNQTTVAFLLLALALLAAQCRSSDGTGDDRDAVTGDADVVGPSPDVDAGSGGPDLVVDDAVSRRDVAGDDVGDAAARDAETDDVAADAGASVAETISAEALSAALERLGSDPLAAPGVPGDLAAPGSVPPRDTLPAPAPAIPGAVRLSFWPDIQRTTSRDDPGDPNRLAVQLHVGNNLGRALERLRVAVRVTPSAEAAELEAAVGDAGWSAAGDDATGCVFELEDPLAPDAAASLLCRFRVGPGGVHDLAVDVLPEPQIFDADFDQVHDVLRQRADAAAGAELLPVVVLLEEPPAPGDEALFDQLGGVDYEALAEIDGFAGRLPAGAVRDLRDGLGERLAMMEPEARAVLRLDTVVANVRAHVPEQTLRGDPATAIAFIDSGIDVAHPDIAAARVRAWFDDHAPAAAAPVDTDGHGTHVVSIAAGTGAGTVPPNPARPGVAPQVGIVGVRYDGSREGWFRRATDLVINNGVANDVVVCNMSLGSDLPNISFHRQVRRMLRAGILPVVAMANTYADNGFGGSPEHSPYVLAVGSVESTDLLTWYSGNGFALQPYRPDLVAPGGAITIDNAFNVTNGVWAALTPVPGGGAQPYVAMSGTSMATPVVSGAAALVVEAMTEYGAADDDGDVARTDEEIWNGRDDDRDGIIDEDTGRWTYTEAQALRLKGILSMATFEISGGQQPYTFLWYDRDGSGGRNLKRNLPALMLGGFNLLRVVGDELIINPVPNRQLNPAGGDTISADFAKVPVAGVPGGGGGAPSGYPTNAMFPGGVSAARRQELRDLVADAEANQRVAVPPNADVPGFLEYVFENAEIPNDPLLDDFGNPRNPRGAGDGFDRGLKDPREGYGRLQIDAAVAAVTEEFCGEETGTFGANPPDSKVWIRHVHLYTGKEYRLILDGRASGAGADYDLYLYAGDPDRYGQPVLARATDGREILAIAAGNAHEQISFEVPADGLYYVVARRVSGAGSFTVRLVTPEEWTIVLYMAAESDGRGGDLDALVDAALDDLEATGSGEEAMRHFQVIAQVDYANRSYDGDPAHNGHSVRYCVRKDHRRGGVHQYSVIPGNGARGEVNMGDPATLGELVEWAVDHFPARHYALLFWGNGHGWKVNRDQAVGPGADTEIADGNATRDVLTLTELRTALASAAGHLHDGSQYETGTGVEPFIDLLGWDADLMQMVEIGEQVRSFPVGTETGGVRTMVGPESKQHADGWPYEQILAGLAPNAQAWSGEDFARDIVAQYRDYYTRVQPYARHTLSALRLFPAADVRANPEWPDFLDELSAFAGELERGIEDVRVHDAPMDNVQITIKLEGQQQAEAFEDQSFIDLRHFADLIRRSGVPAPWKAHAPDVLRRLRPNGPIVLAETHGTDHPGAQGLSVYFPHDQLLPEQWRQPFLPADPTERFAPTFDNPVPSAEIYAEDRAIRIPALAGVPHPRSEVGGLLFRDRGWDEFLHRYYKPAADACVRLSTGCIDEATVFVGTRVTLSGVGSSDPDGPGPGNVATEWYWDHQPAVETGAGVPPYAVGAGPTVDVPCTDDCDRDVAQEPDDDPESRGNVVVWQCPWGAEASYDHVLHVFDEHHLQAVQHGEHAHGVHYKLDRAELTVHCVTSWIPWKRPDIYAARVGETVTWDAGVHFSGTAERPALLRATDVLPPGLALVGGSVRCSVGECGPTLREDGATVIRWDFSPGTEERVRMTYATETRPREEGEEWPPEDPENEYLVLDPSTGIERGVTVALTVRPAVTCVGGEDCDGDGYAGELDCDERDPDRNVGATERCDGVDNDCDGIADVAGSRPPSAEDACLALAEDCDDAEAAAGADCDGDGVPVDEGDCDDAHPGARPGGVETCDGVDNDCDGLTDEELACGDGALFDHDGDGAVALVDCDDRDAAVRPEAEDPCDGRDADCDGLDAAGQDCPDQDLDGATADEGDCDDWDPRVFPGAREGCDGVDADCDGLDAEGLGCEDQDLDGAPAPWDCDDRDALVGLDAPERCNGRDDDCDGATDEDVAPRPCLAGDCRLTTVCEAGEERCPGPDDCRPLAAAADAPLYRPHRCYFLAPLGPGGEPLRLDDFVMDGLGPRRYELIAGAGLPAGLVVEDGLLTLPAEAEVPGTYGFHVAVTDATGQVVLGFVADAAAELVLGHWLAGGEPVLLPPVVGSGEGFDFAIGTGDAEWVCDEERCAWCLSWELRIEGAIATYFGVFSDCEPPCAGDEACLGGGETARCVPLARDCAPPCPGGHVCTEEGCAAANLYLGPVTATRPPGDTSSDTGLYAEAALVEGWTLPWSTELPGACGFLTLRWAMSASPPLGCDAREPDAVFRTTIVLDPAPGGE